MKNTVIVACGRTALGKAPKGKLRHTRPESLAAQVISGVLDTVPANVVSEIDDLVLGCAFPEGEQGSNIARLVAGLAGLPYSVAGQTINRFCSSGLQSIATAAYAINCGQQKIALAGGIESMSTIPMQGSRWRPNPELQEKAPEYFTAMGITAENVAAKYNISREEQDIFAVGSHTKAFAAQQKGYFAEEIIPIQATGPDGKKFTFEKDEGIRPNTKIEDMTKLKPVFRVNGSVTAGNASQTTDGAAIVLLMEEDYAKELGLKPIARFVSFAVAGVEPAMMGIGPVKAIPQALRLANLSLDEIDLVELNEAFAAQALACMNVLNMNPDIVNVNGGAIALGHPLGCTGSALTVKLLHELRRRNKRLGMVSMCIGGGQGAAGVFEMC